MLLEKNEFVREKKCKTVHWIEKIDTHDKMVEIGTMNYDREKSTYYKTFEAMSTKEFYDRYTDL